MSTHYRLPQTLIKTVAATGTPERMSATSIPCTQAIIIGRKAAQTDNVTDINIGTSSADGTQPIVIGAGGQFVLAGVDLFEWYIDVQTAADGVVIVYW